MISRVHSESITLGFLLGVAARIALLRSDYRQYPTYPHGYTGHLFLGVMASLAGAVAVPALVEREWTAVTFFLVVAQQFRDIRGMERDSLKAMEDDELVPRGTNYIEGIAQVFEARYYVVISVAAAASVGREIGGSIWSGVLFGALAFGFGAILMGTERLGESVHVSLAKVHFKGPDLWVDNVMMLNVGLEESRQFISDNALGALIVPDSPSAVDTLANVGQRQAILHDLSSILGVKSDSDSPELAPMAERDVETGAVAVFFIPVTKEPEAFLDVIRRTIVLESAKGRGYRAGAGQSRRLHRR